MITTSLGTNTMTTTTIDPTSDHARRLEISTAVRRIEHTYQSARGAILYAAAGLPGSAALGLLVSDLDDVQDRLNACKRDVAELLDASPVLADEPETIVSDPLIDPLAAAQECEVRA
jgi:hypothetical protein